MTRRLQTPQTIWLTGAGSGIGEAVARHLLGDGHRLVVTGRREAPLQALRGLAPDRVTPAPGDTTVAADLDRISTLLDDCGPVQMGILNAGTCEYLDVAHFRSDIIEHNIHTNVIGTARSIEMLLPHLRASRRRGLPATLVIVSSSAWWFPFARAEGYGASKAALSYMAQSLRADLAAEGIDVVVVSPGFVKTPLTERNDFPMPFLVSPEDAAARITSGLARGRNEIEFPRRFTWMLRLLGALPRPLVDRMAAAMSRQQN